MSPVWPSSSRSGSPVRPSQMTTTFCPVSLHGFRRRDQAAVGTERGVCGGWVVKRHHHLSAWMATWSASRASLPTGPRPLTCGPPPVPAGRRARHPTRYWPLRRWRAPWRTRCVSPARRDRAARPRPRLQARRVDGPPEQRTQPPVRPALALGLPLAQPAGPRTGTFARARSAPPRVPTPSRLCPTAGRLGRSRRVPGRARPGFAAWVRCARSRCPSRSSSSQPASRGHSRIRASCATSTHPSLVVRSRSCVKRSRRRGPLRRGRRRTRRWERGGGPARRPRRCPRAGAGPVGPPAPRPPTAAHTSAQPGALPHPARHRSLRTSRT